MNDFNRSTTVKPILDLIGQGSEHRLDLVHRGVATREELAHHLRRWRRTPRYGLLYLGFHGEPGRLYLGDQRLRARDAVTLDDIAAMLGTRLRGRLVHFGSCGTFGVDRRHILRFLRRTGVTAATGFATDLDWLRAAAFELLLLSTLLRYRVNLRGARRMREVLAAEAPSLRRELGFRMVINEP